MAKPRSIKLSTPPKEAFRLITDFDQMANELQAAGATAWPTIYEKSEANEDEATDSKLRDGDSTV